MFLESKEKQVERVRGEKGKKVRGKKLWICKGKREWLKPVNLDFKASPSYRCRGWIHCLFRVLRRRPFINCLLRHMCSYPCSLRVVMRGDRYQTTVEMLRAQTQPTIAVEREKWRIGSFSLDYAEWSWPNWGFLCPWDPVMQYKKASYSATVLLPILASSHPNVSHVS